MDARVKCKKCRTEFDSRFGICPKCGTVCEKKESTIIIGKTAKKQRDSEKLISSGRLLLAVSCAAAAISLVLIVLLFTNVFSVFSPVSKETSVVGTAYNDLPYTQIVKRFYEEPPVEVGCVSEYDEQTKTLVICMGSFDAQSYEELIGQVYAPENYKETPIKVSSVFSQEASEGSVLKQEFVYDADGEQYLLVYVSKGAFDCKSSLEEFYYEPYDEQKLKNALEELELAATVKTSKEYSEVYGEGAVMDFEYRDGGAEGAVLSVLISNGEFPIEDYEEYVGKAFTNELKAELQGRVNVTVSDDASAGAKVISKVRFVYETNKLEVTLEPSETNDSEE